MSVFFNYNKEGRGVTRADVEAESPVKRFFSEFFHRFWQLVFLNVIYLIACVPIVTIGPATAAMNYVCRNFTQGKPVSFFSDFVEKCKEHFKQGLAVGLIQVFSTVLLVLSFLSWTSADFNVGGTIRTIAVIVIFLVAYLMFFGSFYLYPMMVSFDLTVKQLFRNSFILAMTQLWRNLIILGVTLLLLFLTGLIWPVTFPVFLFLFFAVLFFTSNALVFPVLMRYVALPEEEAAAEESDEEPQEVDVRPKSDETL